MRIEVKRSAETESPSHGPRRFVLCGTERLYFWIRCPALIRENVTSWNPSFFYVNFMRKRAVSPLLPASPIVLIPRSPSTLPTFPPSTLLPPSRAVALPVADRSRLRIAGLTACLALLLGSNPAWAGQTENNRAADSLSAPAVAFEFRYGTGPLSTRPSARPSRDQWLARDKAKHVAMSALWTLSTQYVLVNKADWSDGDALPASIASGAAIGVAKELYDASRPTGMVSEKDLVANAVGIGLAVGVIML